MNCCIPHRHLESSDILLLLLLLLLLILGMDCLLIFALMSDNLTSTGHDDVPDDLHMENSDVNDDADGYCCVISNFEHFNCISQYGQITLPPIEEIRILEFE